MAFWLVSSKCFSNENSYFYQLFVRIGGKDYYLRKERRKIKEPGAVPRSAFPSSGVYILTEGCLLSGSSGRVAKTKPPNLYLLSFLPSCSLPVGAAPLLLLPTVCRGSPATSGILQWAEQQAWLSVTARLPASQRPAEKRSAGRSVGCCLPLSRVSPHRLARGCHLRGDGAGPAISVRGRLFSAQQGREIKQQFSPSSSHFW